MSMLFQVVPALSYAFIISGSDPYPTRGSGSFPLLLASNIYVGTTWNRSLKKKGYAIIYSWSRQKGDFSRKRKISKKLSESDPDPKGRKQGNPMKIKIGRMNMGTANELFEKTNALAEKLGKAGSRIKIDSAPSLEKQDEKKILMAGHHRYGPEDEPLILSAMGNYGENPSVQERTPLAFCPNCNAGRQMKWKPPEKRGKAAESWFTCAICACDCLAIKRMSHAEAVKINMKEKNERGKYEQRQS